MKSRGRARPSRPCGAHGPVVHRTVHFLDLLGVLGGQPGEHDHADHRDDLLQLIAAQEDVCEARDDDPEQAHDQERTQRGEIASRGVALQAQGSERRRGDEEHPGGLGYYQY
jgi:hypothetical protein